VRLRTSNCSLLLIYLPRKDERQSQPGWLTYSGRFTHISGHPSAAGRRACQRPTFYDCAKQPTASLNLSLLHYITTILLPVGHVRDVMLVWRKGMSTELSVSCSIAIITVHKSTSSSYRLSVGRLDPALILLGLALSSDRLCIIGFHD